MSTRSVSLGQNLQSLGAKHKLWRLWRSVASRERHDASQVGGCTLGKSNFEDPSLNGAICRLQLGCADAPSCSIQGRKALPEGLRTRNSHLPPCRHVQEGTGNVSPGPPAAFPPQTLGLHPFFCFHPLRASKNPTCPWRGCIVHGTA